VNIRLQNALLRCEAFESDAALRSLFVDERIIAWRNELPSASSLQQRVMAVVSFLMDQYHDRENALVSLLYVLSDHLDPDDDRQTELRKLATELEKALNPVQVFSARINELHTKLMGTRIVQVSVSQLFRVADFLMYPESVKAKGLYSAFTDSDKMRRTFNRRKSFNLGELGSLKPVVYTSEKYDSFWKPAMPDLRKPTTQPLCFVPYELSLSEYLRQFHCDLTTSLPYFSEKITDFLHNVQVDGHLRIYPPGVGVVKLGLTLEFREAVYVEVIAAIARHIENLYFVDPVRLEQKPCETLLMEIVDRVSESLFVDGGYDYKERRWQPPVTTFSFRDDEGMMPDEIAMELAYLMSLAPGNEEDLSRLKDRVLESVRSSHWRREKVLAVAAQGVALLFTGHISGEEKDDRRKALNRCLMETHELVSAAAYAQSDFAEEVEELAAERLLDETWLVQDEDEYAYLFNLLSTMAKVMRAVYTLKPHLRKQSSRALLPFAENIWAYSNPIKPKDLHEDLKYLADWLAPACSRGDAGARRLYALVETVQHIESPFAPKEEVISSYQETGSREELETRILKLIQETDSWMVEKLAESDQIEKRFLATGHFFRKAVD
jgi:hypothetical protein